ncbi:MAG: hypothetical protein Q9219_002687 [cf. Caloplaca sp. 3 TL-2023]
MSKSLKRMDPQPPGQDDGSSSELSSCHPSELDKSPSEDTKPRPPAPSGLRQPTEEEQVAARAKARELDNQIKTTWLSRKNMATLKKEKEKQIAIAKGEMIGPPTPKRRGRPPRKGKNTGSKPIVDSEPEVDEHGYLPGERQAEERRFARLRRKSFFMDTDVPTEPEDDPSPLDQEGHPVHPIAESQEKSSKTKTTPPDASDTPSPAPKRRRVAPNNGKTVVRRASGTHEPEPLATSNTPTPGPPPQMGYPMVNPYDPHGSPYIPPTMPLSAHTLDYEIIHPYYPYEQLPAYPPSGPPRLRTSFLRAQKPEPSSPPPLPSPFHQRLAHIAHGNTNLRAHLPPGFNPPATPLPPFDPTLKHGVEKTIPGLASPLAIDTSIKHSPNWMMAAPRTLRPEAPMGQFAKPALQTSAQGTYHALQGEESHESPLFMKDDELLMYEEEGQQGFGAQTYIP